MAGEEWLAAGAMNYWWESLINWKYPPQQGRVCVCVCCWSKWLHLNCNQLMHKALFWLLFCTGTHCQTFTVCNHKYERRALYYSYKLSPGGSNNLRQSAECQLLLNNRRHLCWERLPRCWCPTPASGEKVKDEAVKRWATGPKRIRKGNQSLTTPTRVFTSCVSIQRWIWRRGWTFYKWDSLSSQWLKLMMYSRAARQVVKSDISKLITRKVLQMVYKV